MSAMIVGVAMAGSTASFAYRPFDGTDAAVADPQEVEIELEPAGVLRQNAQTFPIPTAVGRPLHRSRAQRRVFGRRVFACRG